MRLYIAGPMTGIPQFNFPAFDLMAYLLRADGHEVVSPAELDSPEDRALALLSPDGHEKSVTKSWGDFLSRDVKLIADGGIEGIVVLPGWAKSRGARLETFVGRMLCGIKVYRRSADSFLVKVGMLELARGWLAKRDISFHSEYEEEVAA